MSMDGRRTQGPAYTVDRHGGIFSVDFGPYPWWHWRGILARVRDPHYARHWREEKERMDAEQTVTYRVLLGVTDHATAQLKATEERMLALEARTWAVKREAALRRAAWIRHARTSPVENALAALRRRGEDPDLA